MSIELFLWGVIPAVIAVFSVIVSFASALRINRWLIWAVYAAVMFGSAYSLLLLKRMFFDAAYPVFISHVLVGLSAAASLVQWRLGRRVKQNA